MAPLIRMNFERSRWLYGIRFFSAADVGCGTGRFLVFLLRYCNVVYGVDKSTAMLAQARCRTANKSIPLLRQDLRELQLPRQVDLITCTFDTLNYMLTRKGLKKALRCVANNLSDGGHFVFDVITGAGERMRGKTIRQRFRISDAEANWLTTMDGQKKLSRVEMLWLSRAQDGRLRRWREVHLQRWLPLTGLCRLLSQCGLFVRGIHDAASFEPATARTFWAHLVACKRPH